LTAFSAICLVLIAFPVDLINLVLIAFPDDLINLVLIAFPDDLINLVLIAFPVDLINLVLIAFPVDLINLECHDNWNEVMYMHKSKGSFCTVELLYNEGLTLPIAQT
jgi:hypothetical protein